MWLRRPIPILDAHTRGQWGHWKEAAEVEADAYEAFLHSLALVICSLLLVLKAVLAVCVMLRHLTLSAAQASSSLTVMPQYLRLSLMQSLYHFFGCPVFLWP